MTENESRIGLLDSNHSATGRDWIWFYDSINNIHKTIKDSVKEDYRSVGNQIDSSGSYSDPYTIVTVGRGEYVFVLEG